MKKSISALLITLMVLSAFLVFTSPLRVMGADGLGEALSFNGVDKYVQVADNASLKGMTNLTLEAWIEPNSYPQYAGIIGKWTYPTTMQYILGYFSGGNLTFWVGHDTTTDSITVLQPPLGVWTHIVAVFTGGSSLEVFYNGTLQGFKLTTLASIGVGLEPLYIGKYDGYFFNGTIDEVRIYNRSLSLAEVSTHYDGGIGQYGRPENGLVAGWHFDESSGTVAHDYSGNKNDGTICGTASWVAGIVPLPDVAVTSVTLSPAHKVLSGVTININVTAKNLGTPLENFTLNAYANDTFLGTLPVTNLAQNAATNWTLNWDTTGVPLGNYTIKANATYVQGETNTGNNEMIGGWVWLVKLPVASFTYSPMPAVANYSTTFNASGSTPDGGSIVNYTWNFDDGNVTSTSIHVITHVYALYGTYNVTLTVEDSEGLTNSTSQSVMVLRHDVAVIDVVSDRTWVYQGHSANVNVTVLNKGDFPETVNVTLYYNITASQTVGTQNISMPPGENQTISFPWDTTSVEYCHNYTLTAVASIAFLDNNPADNTLSDGNIKVRIMGDINGDGKVDGKDITLAALAFGTVPGDARWNLDFDINQDGKIDGRDLTLIALRFGMACFQ
jgi:PKD repeat protein